eukprot:13518073-Alexandrium_andersonii.AAC.1
MCIRDRVKHWLLAGHRHAHEPRLLSDRLAFALAGASAAPRFVPARGVHGLLPTLPLALHLAA